MEPFSASASEGAGEAEMHIEGLVWAAEPEPDSEGEREALPEPDSEGEGEALREPDHKREGEKHIETNQTQTELLVEPSLSMEKTNPSAAHMKAFIAELNDLASLLRGDTKLAAALFDVRDEDDDKTPPISELFSHLQQYLSEYRSKFLRLKHRVDFSLYEDSEDQVDWEHLVATYWREFIRYRHGKDSAAHLDLEEETEPVKKAKEQIFLEEQRFVNYSRGKKSICHGNNFKSGTMLSPMLLTHCTPGLRIDHLGATTGTSLQVFSFKISEIKCDLEWPLLVYGVVNARDSVDCNRNILFYRTNINCQLLTRDDPFLRLTGPSRGILAINPLDFEVQLRVKGISMSRDRTLIMQRSHYSHGDGTTLRNVCFDNCLCTAQLSLEQIENSVQATFLGVRIIKGGSFSYGGRVAISQGSTMDANEVVLLDSRGGEVPMGTDGHIDLSRRVVSVEINPGHEDLEGLKVVLEAYSESGRGIAARGDVTFKPKLCYISQATCDLVPQKEEATCDLGGYQVEITVAWSVSASSRTYF